MMSRAVVGNIRTPGRVDMQDQDTTIDDWAERLAAFAVTPFELDEQLRQATLVRVVDTIGTALGATGSDASEVVERYAGDLGPRGRHAVWGTAATTDLESAALVNGVKARYLDFNDAYFGVSICHPSDVIPALFATALEVEADDVTFLRACAIAYEAIMRAADTMPIQTSGYDHVQMTILGGIAGCAHLLGLSEAQARHAVGICVTSHVSLRQTRTGQLSMWKAFAAADSCRHALVTCRLAAAGAEGPIAPFTGLNGVFRRLFDLTPDVFPPLDLEAGRVPRGIATSQLKNYPLGAVGQSAAQAGEQLVAQGVRLEDVQQLEVMLDPKAYPIMVSPEKLAPRTRETADHSIPYVLVSALRRGHIDVATFDAAAIADPVVQDFLASSVIVSVDETLAGGHDRGYPMRVRATLSDGRVLELTSERAPGTPGNEMSPARLREKFTRNVERSALAERVDELWDAVWSLGSGTDGVVRLDRMLRTPPHAAPDAA